MIGHKAIDLLTGYYDRAIGFVKALSRAQEDVKPRRFKGEDLCEIVGVTRPSIAAAIEGGKIGNLKETFDPKAGATLGQVNEMQAHFKTSPRRKSTDAPVTLAFTNFKGGCWKTTTCWYAASYYASLGYRVLCVDLDPQASLTENFGYMPNINVNEDQTLVNHLCGIEGYTVDDVRGLIHDTYNENIKIIPSCLALSSAEMELVMDLGRASQAQLLDDFYECFFRLKGLLSEVKNDFDIILLDGTPSLGMLPMNIVFAADAVVVPVPTEISDFFSTIASIKLFKSQYTTLHEGFPAIEFPKMAFLPTRYSASASATNSSDMILSAIRETFGTECLQSYIRKHESVVSNLSMYRRTVFDINAGTVSSSLGDFLVNSKTRRAAMSNFSAAFDEILKTLVFPHWPSRSRMDRE